jgi:hypothetical protein
MLNTESMVLMNKNGKNLQREFLYIFIFGLKIAIYLSQDVQATGEAFSPQKRTSST